MSLLNVSLEVQNSAVPTDASEYVAIVGYSTQGPTGDFVASGSLTEVEALFSKGPLVTLAEIALNAGKKVALWRESVAAEAYGTNPTIVDGGGSFATVTYDGSVKPWDRSFASVKFTVSGTIGTAGIKYKIARSYNPTADDYGPELELGTALFILTADGIKLDLTSGELVTATSEIRNAEGRLPTLADATITASLARVGTTPLVINDVILGDAVTSAKIALIKTALDALKVRGVQPTVIGALASPAVGVSAATYAAACAASVDGVDDYRICVTGSDAEFASAGSNRAKCMYPFVASFLEKVCRLKTQIDLRSPASPVTAAGQAETGAFSGPSIQSIHSATPINPIGGWDEVAAGSALSAVRVGAPRFIATYTGTFVADAPVLSQPGTAIQQLSHARVVSRVYRVLYHAVVSYLGQNYTTFTTGPKAGQLVPYEIDRFQDNVTAYVVATLGGLFNDFKFKLTPGQVITTGTASGVFTLNLFNSLVQFNGTISATR